MRKVPVGFQKGKSGNPKGRPKLQDEFKGIRKLSLNEFICKVSKFISMPFDDLKEIFKDKKSTSLDLMIISVITESIKKGDTSKIEFLISRLIGPVKHNINHTGEIITSDPIVNIVLPSNGKTAEENIKSDGN